MELGRTVVIEGPPVGGTFSRGIMPDTVIGDTNSCPGTE